MVPLAPSHLLPMKRLRMKLPLDEGSPESSCRPTYDARVYIGLRTVSQTRSTSRRTWKVPRPGERSRCSPPPPRGIDELRISHTSMNSGLLPHDAR